MEVILKFDGSCLGNGLEGAKGGWGVEVYGDVSAKLYGKLPGDRQTNNRAEIYGAYKAVQWVKEHPEVTAVSIYGDSELVIDGLRGDSQRKANHDLWMLLESAIAGVSARILEIEHIDRVYNSVADHLAKVAANALFIPQDELYRCKQERKSS